MSCTDITGVISRCLEITRLSSHTVSHRHSGLHAYRRDLRLDSLRFTSSNRISSHAHVPQRLTGRKTPTYLLTYAHVPPTATSPRLTSRHLPSPNFSSAHLASSESHQPHSSRLHLIQDYLTSTESHPTSVQRASIKSHPTPFASSESHPTPFASSEFYPIPFASSKLISPN